MADVKEPEPKAPSMTFGEIAEDMWLSFCVRDGSYRPARTAMAYGCKQVDEFTDEVNEITKVIAISRDEWTAR